jgi:phosphatidylserine decarboxylase
MRAYGVIGMLLALVTLLPLAWKWQLGIFRVGLVVVAESSVVTIVVAAFGSISGVGTVVGTLAVWIGTIAVSATTLLVLFFRDPERVQVDRSDVVVSPADGRVIYVRSVSPGVLPVAEKKGSSYALAELKGTTIGEGGAVAVGISMNLADVHVNRAPIAGRVRLVERVHGTFGSLRDPEMLFRNERATTVIESERLEVAVVQIASRLVRRIVGFVSSSEELQLGQRIGAIRLGSQVDLLIPASRELRLAVQVGDKVVAGRTIMAVIFDSARQEAECLAEITESSAAGWGVPAGHRGVSSGVLPDDRFGPRA